MTQGNHFIKSSRKRRIVAFIIDHYLMVFVLGFIAMIALGTELKSPGNGTHFILILCCVLIPGMLLYFCKDAVKGISIGKWVMGIMVRDENNPGEVPSFGRLLKRNLTLIIWPIEFLVLALSNDKKRWGDSLAHTTVLKNPVKAPRSKRILVLAGTFVFLFTGLFFIVMYSMKNSDAYKTALQEVAANEQVLTETGGIVSYGVFPKGNIHLSMGYGEADFTVSITGKKGDMDVFIYLEKQPDTPWKVVEMQDEDGTDLLTEKKK